MSYVINQPRKLEFYQRLVASANCRWCDGDLGPLEVIKDFGEGGWPVIGYDQPVWLYATCLECEYQWALWKLIQDLERGGYARRLARRAIGKKPPQPRPGMGFCTPGHETDCQNAKEPECVCACNGRNHRKWKRVMETRSTWEKSLAEHESAFDTRTAEEKAVQEEAIAEAERTDPPSQEEFRPEDYPEADEAATEALADSYTERAERLDRWFS